MTFLKMRLSLCLLAASLSFLMVFTVNSRHAARYVFPAYYLFSAWSILALFHVSSVFNRLHLWATSFGLHLLAPLLWLMIFSLHFL
jgi:hypothetical protein